MGATVFVDSPIGGDEVRIDCEEARVVGDLVWAIPDDGEQTVIPLSNVTGIKGELVEQEVEQIESPGGRFTELVTDIS
ncbi:hypothetical protein [Natronomonas sp.]|uniref:hypothetical protein n=1 Tax=Natronomonas sp. TaxID=2184060 RepID=UPI002FC2A6D1